MTLLRLPPSSPASCDGEALFLMAPIFGDWEGEGEVDGMIKDSGRKEAWLLDGWMDRKN